MVHAQQRTTEGQTQLPPTPAAMIRSRAAQFSGLVRRIVQSDQSIDARQIHKLRVLARRLRVALSVLAPPEQDQLAAKLRKQAGSLRRDAGAIRDCDVHLELLSAAAVVSRTKRPYGIDDAIHLVRQDRANTLESLLTKLRGFKAGRFLRLAELLSTHIDDYHQAQPDRAAALAGSRARAAFERLVAAAAQAPSTPEAFHQLRLAVKAFRYSREALAASTASDPAPATALADIQSRLGELNDVATLADRLNAYAAHIDTQHASEMLPAVRQQRDALASLANGFSAVFSSRAAQFGGWWQAMYGHGDIASLAPDIALHAQGPQGERSMILPQPDPAAPFEPLSGTAHLTEHPTTPAIHDESRAGNPLRYGPADLWLAGKVIGIIDIGSNSIRLLVVELIDQLTWKVLLEDRSMTRLAHGLTDSDMLSPEAVSRSVDAIARFAATATAKGCEIVAAFATSAVRDASNGGDFVREVHDRCGVQIRIVPAAEEGRLTFDSVARVFDLSREPVAVADLGGGSLQVLNSRRGVITGNVSMPLGAVRVTERYTPTKLGSSLDVRKVRKGVDRVLAKRLAVPRKPPRLLIGCGGTFTTIATLAAAARGTPIGRPDVALSSIAPISRFEVRELATKLAALTDDERARIPGLPADRADIIVAGVITVERTMKRLGCQSLLVHSGGIREGLVLKMVRELLAPQPPKTSPALLLQEARELAVRCGYERRHSEHVATLCGQLYDALLSAHLVRDLGTTPIERSILEAAAVLHDVGMLVSYKGHHRHSAAIVSNNGLTHVPPEVVAQIAMVCRYHRKRGPLTRHRAFATLPAAEQNLITRLAAILRVADGLDRSHAQLVRSIRVTAGKRILRIECTTDSAEITAEHDAAMSKGDVLSRILGLDLDVISVEGEQSPTA